MTPADERRWRDFFEAALRPLISGLSAIKNQLESIEQGNEAESSKEPPPQPIIRAELDLPIAIGEASLLSG